MTDVWVFATDGAGEYARWQVPVSVGTSGSSRLMSLALMAPGDMTLREDDIATIPHRLLAGVFMPGVCT